jgi:uncharacterized protein
VREVVALEQPPQQMPQGGNEPLSESIGRISGPRGRNTCLNARIHAAHTEITDHILTAHDIGGGQPRADRTMSEQDNDADNPATFLFEHIHDDRLVRPSAVRDRPLFQVIVVSWLIAFAEYCFQVPANRIGFGEFTGYQLKIIQEIITLIVFAVFAYFYLKEAPRWNYILSFGCLLGAVTFALWDRL